jgi:Plasmid pRiA4b ORF-3-like protein
VDGKESKAMADQLTTASKERLVNKLGTITDLHYIVQIVMGWTDAHLHRFVIHGKDYGIAQSGGNLVC